MTPRRAFLFAALAAAIWPGMSAQADEAQASAALRQLFAASDLRVGAIPGCDGALPGVRRVTLGALVASRLAVFQTGENRIDGHCGGDGQCEVTIGHADGEDVSSLRLTFRSLGGKMTRSSLRCAITP